MVFQMKQPKIVILGAGPAGLGAAWRLSETGFRNFTVIERGQFPGGLASSITDANGFTWDIGGHVIHSHYAYFDRMLDRVMGSDFLTHERISWVFLRRQFIPYPFQNNIHKLPPSLRDACLAGLRDAARKKKKPIGTFADWIVATYGRGIADCFLLPYNRKVWAFPPERMGYAWTKDRVAPIDLAKIEENIKHDRNDISWGPNALFRFPKTGGTGEIWKRTATHIGERQIRYGVAAERIDPAKRVLFYSDGTSDPYDALLSTIPLDGLIGMLPASSSVPVPTAHALHASAVTIVGLGIRGITPAYLKKTCWMYFPEETVPFFRATVMSNYSPANAPVGTWSLMMEISSSPSVPLKSSHTLIDSVIGSARLVGLLREQDEIVDRFSFSTPYGYPTPTLERDTFLDRALPKLETYGISSRGRFGAWKYEVSNQDHAFMQGVEWADRIVTGTPEQTVWHPESVNG